jgi:transcriptional regulator with XRE-family HTH domain
MPKKLAPPTERRLAKQPSRYDSKPFITRILKLLEERNESYREAALASSLDHQALHRYLTGYRRPHMHACILLADHFGINPNEFLQLANYPPLKVFDVQTANAERLPPEAVDVAMDLARIPDSGMRKAVAEAMRALLKQYFRV